LFLLVGIVYLASWRMAGLPATGRYGETLVTQQRPSDPTEDPTIAETGQFVASSRDSRAR